MTMTMTMYAEVVENNVKREQRNKLEIAIAKPVKEQKEIAKIRENT